MIQEMIHDTTTCSLQVQGGGDVESAAGTQNLCQSEVSFW